MQPKSVEINIAFGWRFVGIFFRLTEQFVEFSVEHFLTIFLLRERFLKGILAPLGLALQPRDRSFQIADRGWPFMFFVTDDGARFGVDLKLGLTAGTCDCKEFRASPCHAGIVAQTAAASESPPAPLGPLWYNLEFGCRRPSKNIGRTLSTSAS